MGTPAQFIFQPSTARVVVVDGFGPFPRGTWQAVPTALSWPVKDPGDTLDYVVDLSAALAGDIGDGIATLDVAIAPANPGDLVLAQSKADGDQAILWLYAGRSGTTYAVTVVIGTQSGRTIARTIGLAVMSLSTPTPFGTDITDQNGVPLTDQTGTPLIAS
jgi:hypothetical protein